MREAGRSGYAGRVAAARARAAELYKRLSELASRRGELDRAEAYDRSAKRYQRVDESQSDETPPVPQAGRPGRRGTDASVDGPRTFVEDNPRVGW